jgi:hypothetical protein
MTKLRGDIVAEAVAGVLKVIVQTHPHMSANLAESVS